MRSCLLQQTPPHSESLTEKDLKDFNILPVIAGLVPAIQGQKHQ
jgi:hypothetical protein